MIHYEIEVNENKGNNLEVIVKMKEFNPTLHPKMYFGTERVIKYLKENNYEFGKCLQSSSLYNRDITKLNGTWIFEKKKLDKPAENVILSIEEKKPALKKKSKAKKKTSK